MKIEVTWDGADVEMGRKVRARDGSKFIVISTCSSVEKCWSLLRLADGFFLKPMTINGIVQALNDGRFTPEEIH